MIGSNLRLALILMMPFLVSCGDDSPEPETYDFTFRAATEISGATSYIFEGKYKPPLNLIGGEYADHRSVNKVLTVLHLPEISKDAREKSKTTGSRVDRGKYIWKEHIEGKDMVLYRSLCQNKSYKHYDCIWKILITKTDRGNIKVITPSPY